MSTDVGVKGALVLVLWEHQCWCYGNTNVGVKGALVLVLREH